MALVAVTENGEKRGGLAAAVVNGKVYVVGGHTGETPLKLLEEFEPGPDVDSPGAWRRLPPMLARRTYCTANALDGMVYVVGGSADGRTLNTFEVFDTRRGEWAMWFTKPPMQIKRTLHASAFLGERLFVVGGFDGLRDLTLLEEFDSKSNSWRWASYMDRGRSYFSLVAHGEKMYAIGGQDRAKKEGPRAHRAVDRFELYSENWYECAPLLTGRVGCASVVLTCEDGLEYIFACGGSDGDGALASVERYDPRENVWVEAPPMNVQRLGHAAVVVKNRLYAIGGFDGKEPLGTFECFDPEEYKWGPPLPMGTPTEPDHGESSATGSATTATH